MADFNKAGGLPTGYSELLNSARQQLVRMPDGTYAPAPQFGQATTLADVYRNILPSSASDPAGAGPGGWGQMVGFANDPIYRGEGGGAPGFTADTMTATRGEQGGARRANTIGTQQAGTVAMPAGVRPASVDQAFAQIGVDPSVLSRLYAENTTGRMQAEERLPAYDAGGPKRQPMFDPTGQIGRSRDEFSLGYSDPLGGNSAVAAINSQTGKRAPQPLTPSPLLRAQPPQQAPGSTYTIRSGDTLGALAKRFGTTVDHLARANGISNPNKIKAGATLNIGALSKALANPSSGSQPQASTQAIVKALNRPSGYGSKGLSEGGKQLRNAFAYAM